MIELAIVVPTYNERPNVGELVRRLAEALAGIEWEVVFVDDDSPDGTAEEVRALARRERRVRCLQRLGRRGLSRAVIEGVLSTSAPVIAVMDADLQHEEAVLPRMLERLGDEASSDVDIVVATRYAPGGGHEGWDEGRARMSRLATALAHRIVRTGITDPMSGFCAALGGVVFTFYMLSGYGLHAIGLELDAIAAVVIGGTLLAGGIGLVAGTLSGVLVLGLIQTLITFDGTLSSWWTRIVIGALLFAFCLLQRLTQGRSED